MYHGPSTTTAEGVARVRVWDLKDKRLQLQRALNRFESMSHNPNSAGIHNTIQEMVGPLTDEDLCLVY